MMPNSPTPEEITALARAATPGPWEAINEGTSLDNFATSIYGEGYKGLLIARCNQNGAHWNDAAFIVAATPEAWIAQADRIKKLQADLASALEALRPFSDAANGLDPKDDDHWLMWEHPQANEVNVGDFRRAAAELAKHKKETGHE